MVILAPGITEKIYQHQSSELNLTELSRNGYRQYARCYGQVCVDFFNKNVYYSRYIELVLWVSFKRLTLMVYKNTIYERKGLIESFKRKDSEGKHRRQWKIVFAYDDLLKRYLYHRSFDRREYLDTLRHSSLIYVEDILLTFLQRRPSSRFYQRLRSVLATSR